MGSRNDIPATDGDTDYPPSHRTPPQGSHDCYNERRLRVIEKELQEHRERLGDGSQVMVKLSVNVDQLTEAVRELKKQMELVKQPNPLIAKIIDAFIAAIVPVLLLALVWVMVQSGAVPVKPPAVNDAPSLPYKSPYAPADR
jgi:hypothetical protein